MWSVGPMMHRVVSLLVVAVSVPVGTADNCDIAANACICNTPATERCQSIKGRFETGRKM